MPNQGPSQNTKKISETQNSQFMPKTDNSYHLWPTVCMSFSNIFPTKLVCLVKVDWQTYFNVYNVEATELLAYHDDVIKWKHFPRYWPSVRGIHRSPMNSTHKSQWRGALMLPLICVWTNAWVNNWDAGDLRRYRVHYDVTVMRNYCSFVPSFCVCSSVVHTFVMSYFIQLSLIVATHHWNLTLNFLLERLI